MNGTSVRAGGAYVYKFDDQTTEWSSIGSVINGDKDVFSAHEDFGTSIAVAVIDGSFRVAVGAPLSNYDGTSEIGRIYTFGYSLSETSPWVRLEESPIFGERSGDRLGSALDMSSDGGILIVGAPGNDYSDSPGYVLAYNYVNERNTWELVFAVDGEEVGGRFGSSVVILSEDGDTFAIGAPNYNNGFGCVVVYQKTLDGLYQQLGQKIKGNANERLGEANTVSGHKGARGVSVVVGTVLGEVKRYDYNTNTDSWEMNFEVLHTGFNSVTSLATSGDSGLLAVGLESENLVALFEASDSATSTGKEKTSYVRRL